MNARPWRVISLAVGIAALTALAVRADVGSGSAKEPLFEDPTGTNFTCPSGATSTIGPFGFVILNTHGPKYVTGEDSVVSAEVAVKGGIPNATYQIFLNQDPNGCPTAPTGTLTTNVQGNGNGHVEQQRVPGATHFWVSAFDVTDFPAPKSLLRSPAAALD